MERLAEMLAGGYGRFPSEAEISDLQQSAEPEVRQRLDAMREIGSVRGRLCEGTAERSAPATDRAGLEAQLPNLTVLSPEEVDALPFGAVLLDNEGRVKVYNRWEAELARLDPAKVLGRRWFEEIAPCTQAPVFRERYRSILSAGAQEREEFEFAFDLRHGRQAVRVALLRGSQQGSVWIAVARSNRACVRDTEILLRFLCLAMVSGDLERFSVQFQTWFIEFLPTVDVPVAEVGQHLENFKAILGSLVSPSTAEAMEEPIAVANGLVQQALASASSQN